MTQARASLSPTSGTWQHGFAGLGPDFYSPIAQQPLPDPYWVAYSAGAGDLIGLGPGPDQAQPWLPIGAGNALATGMQPIATVYSGHQFGVWAGQLGDGRAVLLGETACANAAPAIAQEVQLKGSGLTPYSRRGDGRAVLRSSIREFLASEAMHALGVPTTRALCVIGSDHPVYREQPETAAVVTRLAPSFIRFGHFEHFCHHGLHKQLRQLADYVIDRYYPECRCPTPGAPEAYVRFLERVTERTADLVAQWQALGFCHGVLNTDNMSILGLTLDYGPFQFLDAFDPYHICNHSDPQGRYAFARQPQVALWNLHALGHALLPLIEDPARVQSTLARFAGLFGAAQDARVAAKLGFAVAPTQLAELVQPLMALLAAERVDWTIFWRQLSHWVSEPTTAVQDLLVDRERFAQWLLQYEEHLANIPRGLAANLMLRTNPAVVLRNYLAERAIQAAQRKDYSETQRLQKVLERPFEERADLAAYAAFPPDWAAQISVSCSS